MPKGEDTKLKSNTGRKRVNLSGALDAETHEILMQEDERLTAESTISFFKKRNLKMYRRELDSLLTENFQIVSA